MNAYRQLLVHLDDSTRNVPRLRAARAIAADHGCSVHACYAVTSSYLEAPYGGEATPALLASLAELDRERRDRARNAFDIELRAPGPAVGWSEAKGIGVVAEFARQALHADLLVLGQNDPSHPGGAGGDFDETVILESGKPALLIPYTGWQAPVGRNAVIAWKETREAARAVTAAIPLLQRAGKVHVLHWGTEADAEVDGQRLGLAGYLRLHGIEASWHEGGDEPDFVGELALSRAFDLGADLLVMGCYGHSRMREFVLGGMTRSILRSMPLPVLMAH